MDDQIQYFLKKEMKEMNHLEIFGKIFNNNVIRYVITETLHYET